MQVTKQLWASPCYSARISWSYWSPGLSGIITVNSLAQDLAHSKCLSRGVRIVKCWDQDLIPIQLEKEVYVVQLETHVDMH